MTQRHKSHRRSADSEDTGTPLEGEETGSHLQDEAQQGSGEGEQEPKKPEEPVDPKDTPEHKAFMASICQIACGVQELTRVGCPAPDAARICETVWCHQNGATIKGLDATE